MTHTRIRPFNTRETYPDQDLDNDLSQAVVAGDTVFLRGQVGQDLDTAESVGIGDPAAQAEQAMRNIEQLLGEAGARLDEICNRLRIDQVLVSTSKLSNERLTDIVGQCAAAGLPVSRAGMIFELLSPTEFGWVMPSQGSVGGVPLIPPHGNLVHPSRTTATGH